MGEKRNRERAPSVSVWRKERARTFCAFKGREEGKLCGCGEPRDTSFAFGCGRAFRQGRREDVVNEKDTMAANPPLVMGMNGCLTPAPFVGEYFILGRDGIKLEMDNVRTRTGKWTAEGYLFLSHVRMVFVAEGRRERAPVFRLPSRVRH